jgi:hypothetical protein
MISEYIMVHSPHLKSLIFIIREGTEKEDKMEDGAIFALIIGSMLITGTGSYLLADTGKNLACRDGWKFQTDTGMYKCQLTASEKFSYCSEVYNSANTKDYWCKEATATKQQPQVQNSGSAKELCSPAPNYGCVPI